MCSRWILSGILCSTYHWLQWFGVPWRLLCSEALRVLGAGWGSDRRLRSRGFPFFVTMSRADLAVCWQNTPSWKFVALEIRVDQNPKNWSFLTKQSLLQPIHKSFTHACSKQILMMQTVQFMIANPLAFPGWAFSFYRTFPGPDFPNRLIENLGFPSFLSVPICIILCDCTIPHTCLPCNE